MELGLSGKRIAILTADGVEDRELTEPRRALDAAGATTQVIAPAAGTVRAARGESATVDKVLGECRASEFDALVVPGGDGAKTLASDQHAVQLVREFMLADKPVAAICHGAALLVAADAVAGRTLTSAPDLREAVTKAGGEWVDVPVKVDERLVTGRTADDVMHFSRTIVKEFGNRIDESRVDQLSEASFPASDPPPGPSSIGGSGAARDTDRIAPRGEGEARP